MGEDRRVSGRVGLLVGGVVVGGAFVLARRLTEVLVLEQEIRHAIVDGGRLEVLRERGEVLAVPVQRLLEVGGLLARQRALLVEGVGVIGEVVEVGLQEAENLGRFVDGEVPPVLGLQSVARGELLLRLENQLREIAHLEDLDHPHAELG